MSGHVEKSPGEIEASSEGAKTGRVFSLTGYASGAKKRRVVGDTAAGAG